MEERERCYSFILYRTVYLRNMVDYIEKCVIKILIKFPVPVCSDTYNISSALPDVNF
jgi:hypothetical protein